MSKWAPSFEKTNVLLCWLCILTLGFVGYWAYTQVMPSTILDNIERTLLLMIALLLYAEIFYYHTTDSKKTFSWIIFVISILGIVTSARHLWLQSSLGMMNDTMANMPVVSWEDFLVRIRDAFIGAGACCRYNTYIYKIFSITELTLLVYGILFVCAFVQQYRIGENE